MLPATLSLLLLCHQRPRSRSTLPHYARAPEAVEPALAFGWIRDERGCLAITEKGSRAMQGERRAYAAGVVGANAAGHARP